MHALKLQKSTETAQDLSAEGHIVRIDALRNEKSARNNKAMAAIAALLREKGVFDRIENR